jgi:hypothetical protein
LKSLFAIYLVEDEEGFVTVKSDHVGKGAVCYEIGVEILANLKVAEHMNPELLAVDHLYYSESLH